MAKDRKTQLRLFVHACDLGRDLSFIYWFVDQFIAHDPLTAQAEAMERALDLVCAEATVHFPQAMMDEVHAALRTYRGEKT